VVSVNAKRIHRGGSSRKARFLTIGLPAAGAILFTTRFYFVSELLVSLAALAVLFSVGTGVLILVVLVQECGRWSVCKFIEAKQKSMLLRGAPSFQSSIVDRKHGL
jgi:hypothetical protein